VANKNIHLAIPLVEQGSSARDTRRTLDPLQMLVEPQSVVRNASRVASFPTTTEYFVRIVLMMREHVLLHYQSARDTVPGLALALHVNPDKMHLTVPDGTTGVPRRGQAL
jgi:hypothetical protein